jgi:hypothetical protein
MATSFESAENYQEFMITFARSVLMWQTIEQDLFVLFDWLVTPQGRMPVARLGVTSAIYYTVIGFKTRFDMLDAAMRTAYEGRAVLDRWSRLAREIRSASKLRNKLAHGSVAVHTDKKQTRTLRLQSTMREEEGIEYTLGQMKGWERTFLELMRDFDAFLRRLRITQPRRSRIDVGTG